MTTNYLPREATTTKSSYGTVPPHNQCTNFQTTLPQWKHWRGRRSTTICLCLVVEQQIKRFAFGTVPPASSCTALIQGHRWGGVHVCHWTQCDVCIHVRMYVYMQCMCYSMHANCHEFHEWFSFCMWILLCAKIFQTWKFMRGAFYVWGVSTWGRYITEMMLSDFVARYRKTKSVIGWIAATLYLDQVW